MRGRRGRPRRPVTFLDEGDGDELGDLLDQERTIDDHDLRDQVRQLQSGSLMDCMASRRAGI